MKYALLVAWREYAENAKTKGFWIGLFVVPLIIAISVQVPIWLETKGTPTRYLALVDKSGTLATVIQERLERKYQRQLLIALNDFSQKHANPGPEVAALQVSLNEFTAKGGEEYYLAQLKPHLKDKAPAFKPPRREAQIVAPPEALSAVSDLAELTAKLKPYLRGEQKVKFDDKDVPLSAAIIIPADILQRVVRPKTTDAEPDAALAGVEYWSSNIADTKLRDEIERTVNEEIRRREYLLRGLDSVVVREVEQTYAPFKSLDPKKEAGKEAVQTSDIIRQWAPSAFVYLLWVAIFAIVQMLLNNIIEEKSNRIIEVLLSSVTPGELMMGKLIGIAAIGLTMVGVWLLAMFGVLFWKTGSAPAVSGPLLDVLTGTWVVPLFAIYFLFGYVMYAALILALGSVCNTLKEAQSYMAVITMMMMVPLLTMTFIPKDPNGVLARVLSWIPIYTPFIMMNRAMAAPPLIDLIGTLVLLVLATAGALWMAARVFRIGILRTGQPPRLLEMLRWLRRRN